MYCRSLEGLMGTGILLLHVSCGVERSANYWRSPFSMMCSASAVMKMYRDRWAKGLWVPVVWGSSMGDMGDRVRE